MGGGWQPGLAARRSRSGPGGRGRVPGSPAAARRCRVLRSPAGVLALRPTGGERAQVACRVRVPVQVQGRSDRSGRCARTGPAWFSPRRSPSRSCWMGTTASQDERPAVPRRFVAEHPPGLPGALVGDRAGEPVVAGRRGQVPRHRSGRGRRHRRSTPAGRGRVRRRAPATACAGHRRTGRAGMRRSLARRRSRRRGSSWAAGASARTCPGVPAVAAPVSRVLMPRSTPITEPGRACRGSLVNLDGERPNTAARSATPWPTGSGRSVLQPAGQLRVTHAANVPGGAG